ncbi:MAG TPA: MBL fold metallo-hydrolase [Candidatus Deferrimicrobiaceae bacterium]|nr:MBL fold metallo-hydrolase [Candidatus Deferrimicrobiaceae bacterium]
MSGGESFRVHGLEVGPLAVNCYIVQHVPSRKAVVIDPGDDGEAILGQIGRLGCEVDKILLTHGHFDHVGAVGHLRKKSDAKVYIHADDVERMKSARRQGLMFGLSIPDTPPPDVLVGEGDRVPFADREFLVAHTPGHTPGCVSYIMGNMAFVGDLIFAGSIGRTDLPGGDTETLLRAVREKIFVLPDETVLFPGHGPASTVGEEKRSNPFFTGGW